MKFGGVQIKLMLYLNELKALTLEFLPNKTIKEFWENLKLISVILVFSQVSAYICNNLGV